ncbi:MAG: hypothetical protein CL868_17670 [Cytophagaceae bacterium]|nr:hypothetical protein [Cytophagaceae bacterium]|tara:strand:+ start:3249 stop:3755 length:507 start_codon:yes stop_codon:yes gene_type:complete
MKTTCATIVLSLGLLLTGLTLQAQKYAYVNSDKILAEMPVVQQAQDKLEAYHDLLKKQLEEQQGKLQTKYNEVLEKSQRGELSPQQQLKAEEELQRDQENLSMNEQEMTVKLQDKRQELFQPIYDMVEKAINEVAKEKGYAMVFKAEAILFAEEVTNATPAVKAKLQD